MSVTCAAQNRMSYLVVVLGLILSVCDKGCVCVSMQCSDALRVEIRVAQITPQPTHPLQPPPPPCLPCRGKWGIDVVHLLPPNTGTKKKFHEEQFPPNISRKCSRRLSSAENPFTAELPLKYLFCMCSAQSSQG